VDFRQQVTTILFSISRTSQTAKHVPMLRNTYQILTGKPRGRLRCKWGGGGQMMLNCILQEQCLRVRSGFLWLIIKTSGAILRIRQLIWMLHGRQIVIWPVEIHSVCPKWLSCSQFVGTQNTTVALISAAVVFCVPLVQHRMWPSAERYKANLSLGKPRRHIGGVEG